MVIKWLDSLCPRLHHLLQIALSKNFYYDLSLAEAATKNSIQMMERTSVGHFESLCHPALAEVVSSAELNNGDEFALRNLANRWKSSSAHRHALINNKNIGIGFAYSPELNLLYATARLR